MAIRYKEIAPMHTDAAAEATSTRAETVVAALRRRHFQARYVPTAQDALQAVLELVPEGAGVFLGESGPVDAQAVVSALWKRNTITGRGRTDARGRRIPGELQEERAVFLSDVYIATADAITLDGRILSADAGGNRVAPMIFGPGKVIIVVGTDCIVKDREAGFARIAQAWPQDGEPSDICTNRGMLESALPRFSQRINVILVGAAAAQ
jgi:hypothetical protein